MKSLPSYEIASTRNPIKSHETSWNLYLSFKLSSKMIKDLLLPYYNPSIKNPWFLFIISKMSGKFSNFLNPLKSIKIPSNIMEPFNFIWNPLNPWNIAKSFEIPWNFANAVKIPWNVQNLLNIMKFYKIIWNSIILQNFSKPNTIYRNIFKCIIFLKMLENVSNPINIVKCLLIFCNPVPYLEILKIFFNLVESVLIFEILWDTKKTKSPLKYLEIFEIY